MTTLRLPLLLLLAIPALPLSAAELPDLTGLWLPDAARSTTQKQLKAETALPAPPAPPPAEALPRLQIDHREPALALRYLDTRGEVISSYAFTADGVESLNDRGGGLVHHSTTTWQGRALVTTWRLESHGATMIGGTDRRELGEGGLTLTVTGEVEDARSRTRSTTVYTLAPHGEGMQPPAPPISAVNAELQRLFEEDQDDGRPYGTPAERAETDARARRRIELCALRPLTPRRCPPRALRASPGGTDPQPAGAGPGAPGRLPAPGGRMRGVRRGSAPRAAAHPGGVINGDRSAIGRM